MGVTWITPVNVTPGTTGSYQDVDVSAHIASGASGVILHLEGSTSFATLKVRKNGSTDDLTGFYQGATSSHGWQAIGVDGSRIFEAYVSTGQKIYLVGYFDSSAVFLTNGTDVEPAGTGAYADVDISATTGGDTAIAAILYVYGGNSNWAARKNGSTDDLYKSSYSSGFIVGCDGSEIFEFKKASANVNVHLIGYITTDVTMNTNATNVSLGSTGSWTALSALPSGATGGFIEIISSNVYNTGLRKNGSSEDIYKTMNQLHAMGMVEADGSQLIEGKIASIDVDFYLVGYSTTGGGGGGPAPIQRIYTLSALGVG